MTRMIYLRSEFGDRDFTRFAVEDPYGPRFERTLVDRADRVLVRRADADAIDRGELVEWRLFSGEQLLAERRRLGRGLRRLGVESEI